MSYDELENLLLKRIKIVLQLLELDTIIIGMKIETSQKQEALRISEQQMNDKERSEHWDD